MQNRINAIAFYCFNTSLRRGQSCSFDLWPLDGSILLC